MRLIKKIMAPLTLFSLAFFLAASPAAADCPTASGSGVLAPFFQVTKCAGLNTGDDDITQAQGLLPQTLGLAVNALFALAGLVFVILIIYAGFLWMTARGNSKQVEDAEHLIRNSIIGIIVTFAAFSISWFVLLSLGYAGL